MYHLLQLQFPDSGRGIRNGPATPGCFKDSRSCLLCIQVWGAHVR